LCREESGERQARRATAWCPGTPLAEPEEVQAGRGEDVAEVDFRLPTVARASQAAAADTAGERALDAGAEGIRLTERLGRLALTRGGAGTTCDEASGPARGSTRADSGTARSPCCRN